MLNCLYSILRISSEMFVCLAVLPVRSSIPVLGPWRLVILLAPLNDLHYLLPRHKSVSIDNWPLKLHSASCSRTRDAHRVYDDLRLVYQPLTMPALSDPNHYAELLVSRAAIDITTRSVKDRLTPNDEQKITLIVAGCYVVVIGILWCV